MPRRVGGLAAFVKNPQSFLEPTLLLTALTGVLYLGGYANYNAYFEAFRLSVATIHIDTTRLLLRGFLLAAVFLFLVFLGMTSKDEEDEPGFVDHIYANSIYLLVAISFLIDGWGYRRFLGLRVESGMIAIYIAIGAGLAILGILWASWKRVNLVEPTARSNGALVLLVATAGIGLMAFASVAGNSSAEGIGRSSIFEVVPMGVEGPDEWSGRSFFLVAHENGHYFLAERGPEETMTWPLPVVVLPDGAVILRQTG